MLFKDPKKRISVNEALKHPWILYNLGYLGALPSNLPKIEDPQFIEYTAKGNPIKINYRNRKSFKRSITPRLNRSNTMEDKDNILKKFVGSNAN